MPVTWPVVLTLVALYIALMLRLAFWLGALLADTESHLKAAAPKSREDTEATRGAGS